MRSLTKFCVGLAALGVFLPLLVHGQATTTPSGALVVEKDEFLRGTVLSTDARQIDGNEGNVVLMKIRIDSGSVKGDEVEVTLGGAFADTEKGVHTGDQVVVVRSVAGGDATYYLADRYRLPWVYGLIAVLIMTAIFVGKKRGVTATLGLASSVAILALVILPQLALGANPILVVLLGGVALATVSTFITHGVNKESGIVLGSILIALVIGTIGAVGATLLLNLGGLGSEEAISLSYGPLATINLQGLLIAGVILGVLGVLDDVAATQVAAVKELADTNKMLTAKQLYKRGMRIGAEHVAALINTLLLAYAGASLPLLLVGKVNLQLPLWAFLNNESVAEEIVRTAVGSSALILAVPIATAFAAWYFGAKRGAPLKDSGTIV